MQLIEASRFEVHWTDGTVCRRCDSHAWPQPAHTAEISSLHYCVLEAP